MGAILEALQLETPCNGALNSMISRAIFRRHLEAWSLAEDSGRGLVHEMVRKMDRFRHRYLPDTADEGVADALGRTLQLLAIDLAEAIYGDEDFAGLLDEAIGDWLILPTIYDMLEYRLPDDFGQRVLKALDCLQEQRPEVEVVTTWLRPALSDCGGMKMRELIERLERRVYSSDH